MNFNPEERLSAEEALKSPWLKKLLAKEISDELLKADVRECLNNVRNFKVQQPLKQASLSFIGSQLLSKAEKEKLSRVYKVIDETGEGKLDKDELLEAFKKYLEYSAFSKDEIDLIFSCIDFDKSGFIDYSEFMIAAMNQEDLLSDIKLQSAFKIFDRNRSGTITKDEIKANLGVTGKEEEASIDAIFAQANMDGDEVITYDEFYSFMRKLQD
jgi:calcium-dependent protein kinase